MNIAAWLSSRGLEPSRPSGGRLGRARDAELRRTGRARRAARERAARARAEARRSRRDHREELRRICRDDPRHLARRLRGGAGERQAAWRASSATSSSIPARASASRRRASTTEVAPHTPASLERLIVIGSDEYRRAVRRRSDAGRAARRRRSRLAVLHLGHHRAGRKARCSRTAISRRRALRI